MKKLTGGKNLKTTMEVLSESDHIDIDKITVCHYYKHKTPYYPHTDFHLKEKENLVIPLKVYDGPNPFLVIFDQYYNEDGRTWTFNKNINFIEDAYYHFFSIIRFFLNTKQLTDKFSIIGKNKIILYPIFPNLLLNNYFQI